MEILNKMHCAQYFPCVVSYFGQLISFSAESSSLDSEISQSLISANEKRPENAGKCICESLEIQNFPGGHAPRPP